MYTDDQIAQVVHAANGALQAVQGDPSPQVPWESFDRKSLVIEAVRNYRNGVTPRESHEIWCGKLRGEGWQYGPVKDYAVHTHPCLVPWEQLPPHQRDKDVLFQQIVLALSVCGLSS